MQTELETSRRKTFVHGACAAVIALAIAGLTVHATSARQEVVETNAASEAPMAPPSRHLCVIDRGMVERHATVNVALNRRMIELTKAVQHAVDADRAALGDQIKLAEQEIVRKPKDATLKHKRKALDEKAELLAAKIALYSREVDATRLAVTRQLQSATTPLVQAAFRASACSLLITRDAIVDSGDSVDITQSVIEAMNTKLQSRPFDLIDLTRTKP